MPNRNSSSSQFTLPKPKEHGAWGMLYIPFVIGVGIAGNLTLETLWLLIATTFAFLSQKPFAQLLSPKESSPGAKWIRRHLAWFCIYAGISAGSFAVLYFHYQVKGLKIFGLLGIPIILAFGYFVRRKEVRTVSGEIAGIVGLTMTGPMAYYVATGEFQAVGFWLWILCILYFVSSIFYVKAVVQSYVRLRSKLPSNSAGMAIACRFYHLGMIVILLLLWILRQLPPLGVLAFVPIIIRGLRVSSKSRSRLDFAIIGWSEVGYSIFFALFLIGGLRASQGLSAIPLR